MKKEFIFYIRNFSCKYIFIIRARAVISIDNIGGVIFCYSTAVGSGSMACMGNTTNEIEVKCLRSDNIGICFAFGSMIFFIALFWAEHIEIVSLIIIEPMLISSRFHNGVDNERCERICRGI